MVLMERFLWTLPNLPKPVIKVYTQIYTTDHYYELGDFLN